MASHATSSQAGRLAVVIPTLNEEERIKRSVERAKPLVRSSERSEGWVIVSDGGSQDRTVEIAQSTAAHVVTGAPGRGVQLQRGAEHALQLGADCLLFLHADTEPGDGVGEAVRAALRGGAAGGGFLIRSPANTRGLLRLAPALVNRRTRRRKRPLGDQGQFASAQAFHKTGGFAPHPILEDLDFIHRLARCGPIHIPDGDGAWVLPDPRRFEQRGVLRTVLLNQLIFLMYYAGVSPAQLERLYR